VDIDLRHLRSQSILVKVGFRQTFDRIVAAILKRGTATIQLHGTHERHVPFVRRRWAREHLAHFVHDGITAGAKLFDDFELAGRFLVIVGMLSNGHKANGFALEETAFSDDITRREDVLQGGRTYRGEGGWTTERLVG
jgi:hypothetical protein